MLGCPLHLNSRKSFSVIGFDINEDRVKLMRQDVDPSQELTKKAFEDCDIEFTSDLDVLRTAHFYIVAVPTPVDENNMPDLIPVKKQKIVYKPLPQDDPKQRQPDISKAKSILGWEPKISRKEGVKITYEYLILR